MIRTIKEFSKQIERSHDCEKCRGKIICIESDNLGNTYCNYCHEKVDYPKPTKQEIEEWEKEMNG